MKEAAPLENLLKKIIKKLGPKERLTEEDMFLVWQTAVGERAAAHSRPRSLRRSRLLVNVDDSGWLYELTLKKKEIMKALEGNLKGRAVKDIRLRIGEIKAKK